MPTIPDLIADLALSLRFFSRLPVPRLSSADDPARPRSPGDAAGAIPLAGALVALPAALLGAALSATALPPLVVAGLVLAGLVVTTGAFHEDGLADVADGIFGGSTPERRLEIMKDSRIGSFGTLALALTVLIRAAALAALATAGPLPFLAGLVATAAASRAVMVLVWHRLPNARPDGLSGRAGRPGGKQALAALLLALLLALPAGLCIGPAELAAALTLAAVSGLLLSRLALARIGGRTGDVLGAAQQLAETGILIGLVS